MSTRDDSGDIGEDDEAWLPAFGYRRTPYPQAIPEGIQVGESIFEDTLEPYVLMSLRFGDRRIGCILHPDMADNVAHELRRWAKRAREKSLNPPDTDGG